MVQGAKPDRSKVLAVTEPEADGSRHLLLLS